MSEYEKWVVEVDQLTDASNAIRKRIQRIKADLVIVQGVIGEIEQDYTQKNIHHAGLGKIVVDQDDGTHKLSAAQGRNSYRLTSLTVEVLADELRTCFVEWRDTEAALASASQKLSAAKAARLRK